MEIVLPRNHGIVTEVGREGVCLHTCTYSFFRVEYKFFLLFMLQIVPYLICMSTDVEKVVSHSADKQLQDIEKKYPGFIHMKSQSGIRLSYKLQKILQSDNSGIVRGYRVREGEFPGALNGFLYSILRNTKQQRRALVLSVLKQFDEQVVSYKSY